MRLETAPPYPGLSLCAVRWCLRYSLSLHDAKELPGERGLAEAMRMIRKGQARWGEVDGPFGSMDYTARAPAPKNPVAELLDSLKKTG